MLDEQNLELEKLILEVNGVTNKLQQIKTTGGAIELKRLTSVKPSFRCRKTRTIKLEEDEDLTKTSLTNFRQSFFVQNTNTNTKKETKIQQDEAPSFDFDLTIPVIEKKEKVEQKQEQKSSLDNPPPPPRFLISLKLYSWDDDFSPPPPPQGIL
jgi:hypothetical protein